MKSTIWIGGFAATLLLAGAAGAQTNCSGQVALFTCSIGAGTVCTPTAAVSDFIMLELLSAAQGCDDGITEDTSLFVAAAGGSGGEGGSNTAAGGHAGNGGVAAMATTIADLNSTNGADAQYCLGIGGQGTHSGDGGGTGGAASILRTCANASATATTGVVVIAGGAGGGGGGGGFVSGNTGGDGGIAISNFVGHCPPDCAPPLRRMQ